jgi:predicted nucleic acid-binding protein
MIAKPFLDTNILIYAFTTGDPRCSTAEALIANGGIVSVQVLNEFVNVARCKLRRDWSDIEAVLGVYRTLLGAPLPLTVEIHESAINFARDHRFAFYDALIIAAASRANCAILLSEDLGDGRRIAGLTIRNPFRTA